MSLRNARFFAMLAVILAFAAVRTSDLQVPAFAVPPTSPSYSAAVAPAPLANTIIRSGWIGDTESDAPPTAFVPVQSKNPDEVAVGKLLVASRDLADPIFAKTVVLVVHSDADGVLGLMLNRRSDIPLSRVLDHFEAAKDRSDPVYLGGPVETPTVFALLQSRTKVEDAESILNGIYFINTKPVFEKVMSARPKPGVFHVYLGYAGWTKKQLQNEIQVGAWFIFPAYPRVIFGADPDSLWREMIRKTELQMARAEPRSFGSQRPMKAVRM